MTMFFSKNRHCDLDLGYRTLKLKIIQDIVILHICGKLNQNRSINAGTRAMTMFFLKISNVTLKLTLEHSNLKLSKILSYLTVVSF